MGEWDRGRLNHALSKLISNAVRREPRSLSRPWRGGSVADGVHNRGVAIPPDRLHGIFDPMKQGEPHRNGPGSGPRSSLGLGLYIADRVISAPGGLMEVDPR